MKILFLCHRFPLPAEGGGKIRALHIIRHLAGSGHDVTVCSLIGSPDEAVGAGELRNSGIRVESPVLGELARWGRMLLRFPSTEPMTFGYFRSRRLARRIAALLREEPPDLILAHCSSMGPYVEASEGIPSILDFADMDSQKWLDYSRVKPFPVSIAYAIEGRKLERREKELSQAFDICTTISLNELETLRGLSASANTDWFPNGVDLEYFSPAGDDYDPDLIVFVGRMDYFPNEQAMQWFCSHVWSKLRDRRATLRLRIVGARPGPAVRRLAQIDGVEVTGSVPDVRPCILRAALSVAPLKIARGMQNKVLESMAMGIPVVTSERVGYGLGLGADSPLRLAETADQYVDSILSLIEDRALRQECARKGRELVESDYSWGSAMRKLDEIIDSVRASTGH